MKKSKLKVAIFHLGFFFSGGGEKLVIEEAKGLTKLGYEVTVFAPIVDPKNCFPDLLPQIKIKSLFWTGHIYFPLRDFVSIFLSVMLTPLLWWRFVKFDILIGANQPGPLICYLLSKLTGKPYLIFLAQPTRILYPRQIDRQVGFGKGSFDLFFFFTKIFRPIVVYLDKISIQGAHMVLTNGDYITENIQKIYKIKTISCPAGAYPTKKILSVKKRCNGSFSINKRQMQKPYILLTNRHFPQKRFDFMISALSFIKQQIPQVKLVVTGMFTGYTEYLKKLVNQLDLTSQVIFTGYLSEKKLTDLYKHAAVYVYTAPEEDFGMGIIEAMGMGVPVVAWKNGGPKTIIKNGQTGYLVRAANLTDFTNKVILLLEDHKLNQKLGRSAWKQVKQYYTYQIHCQKLSSALQRMVKKSYYK